jgi:hypothetical protein
MKETRFYRLSLILPLAVPLLVAPLLLLGDRLPPWLSWVALYITFSGVIGGLPYLVLVGALLFWARRKTDTQFKRALALSPILMLPVFAAMLALAWSGEAWLRPENALPWADRVIGFLGLAPFVLGFGYFYVALVFSTAFMLQRRGVLVPSHAI